MNGIINVLKPPGMTSSDVVVTLRRLLNIKKAGHTGTLDPDAAGVLPICLGKATRLADYIMHATKVYRFELLLGIETDTLDISGNIIASCDEYPNSDQVYRVIKEFTGDFLQKPPMYSAIKVQGQKMYQLARQGQEIELAPRPVTIHRMDLLFSHHPNKYFIEVTCSKGTYVRSLCRDIGRSLGCGGVMSFLIRCQTGEFSLSEAVTLDEIAQAHEKNEISQYIVSMDKALGTRMPMIALQESCYTRIIHGNAVDGEQVIGSLAGIQANESVRIYCQNQFIGIGSYRIEATGPIVFMKNVLL